MTLRSAVLLALLLAGCSGGTGTRSPKELALGVDACSFCHMSVDDARRAAQWIPEKGQAEVFDEPGCLAAWLRGRPDEPGYAWVADEESGRWVVAEEAHYLVDAVGTGMGFDAVAFADRAAAEARLASAGRGGEIIDWNALIARGGTVAHVH